MKDRHCGNGGLLQWGFTIVDVLMTGAEDVTDMEVRHILGDNYMRIQPVLSHSVGMDDLSEEPYLIQVGRDTALPVNWLTHFSK